MFIAKRLTNLIWLKFPRNSQAIIKQDCKYLTGFENIESSPTLPTIYSKRKQKEKFSMNDFQFPFFLFSVFRFPVFAQFSDFSRPIFHTFCLLQKLKDVNYSRKKIYLRRLAGSRMCLHIDTLQLLKFKQRIGKDGRQVKMESF